MGVEYSRSSCRCTAGHGGGQHLTHCALGESRLEKMVVIDFETTGLSPSRGDRATEIAAVLIENGKVVDRYQSLMKSGVRVPRYIESLTGITNEMLATAPPSETVMQEVFEFVGEAPMVAHNASFDCKFWDAELARIGRCRRQEFACSMLLSRRIFPDAPSHKLGELVQYAQLPVAGRFHRALADAEMTTSLVLRIEDELVTQMGVKAVSHELFLRLQRTPAHQARDFLTRVASIYS